MSKLEPTEVHYKCEPGYPYECDFELFISFDEVIRRGAAPSINMAYRQHEHTIYGHGCNLVEQAKE